MGRKPKHCPSFFKVLVDDRFADKLRIPPAFVLRVLEGEVPAKAVIKAQNDDSKKSWTVKVVKKTGEKYNYSFTGHGWRKFVEDCGLKAGEFLVFKLVSNSVFQIVRFGLNGCVKELITDPVIKHETCVSEQIKENHCAPSPKSKEAPPRAAISSDDSLPTDHPRGRGGQFPVAVTDRVIIKGNRRTQPHFVGRKAIVTAQCLNGWFVVKTIDNAESVKLQYRSLDKVSDDPSPSKPPTDKQTEDPSFPVVMKKHCRSRLTLPIAFARKIGMRKKKVLLRNEEGKEWEADVSVRTYQTSTRMDLCGGWSAFRKENKIADGDSCSFKLVKSAGDVIDVVVRKRRRPRWT
ncbi:hypothetical protein Vadar_033628 [Vaccinium darrowii]|uniref:Uncharacterized protein n=1 Tax=Vaccinium darrowii TaxID=229202 RepID=A0ACB7YID4_9ERIC|nr:hypothetical protein Vadar_033628 [Vaccinium darrowii]